MPDYTQNDIDVAVRVFDMLPSRARMMFSSITAREFFLDMPADQVTEHFRLSARQRDQLVCIRTLLQQHPAHPHINASCT